MERRLQENGNGDISDPIRQYDWSLGGVFDTESMPHEMCTSIHVIPNVRGPLRSELMIILGLMGSRLRRKHFQDQEVFPVSYPYVFTARYSKLTLIYSS